MRAVVVVLGAAHLALGLLALLAPATFFDEIGHYGVENLHYVGDVGAFTAGYGAALLLAVRRPTWWAPLLTLGAIWFALHALNHAFDTDEAVSQARGWLDTIVIGVSAAVLAWLARVASRMERA